MSIYIFLEGKKINKYLSTMPVKDSIYGCSCIIQVCNNIEPVLHMWTSALYCKNGNIVTLQFPGFTTFVTKNVFRDWEVITDVTIMIVVLPAVFQLQSNASSMDEFPKGPDVSGRII